MEHANRRLILAVLIPSVLVASLFAPRIVPAGPYGEYSPLSMWLIVGAGSGLILAGLYTSSVLSAPDVGRVGVPALIAGFVCGVLVVTADNTQTGTGFGNLGEVLILGIASGIGAIVGGIVMAYCSSARLLLCRCIVGGTTFLVGVYFACAVNVCGPSPWGVYLRGLVGR